MDLALRGIIEVWAVRTLVAVCAQLAAAPGASTCAAEAAPNDVWLISTRQAPFRRGAGGEDRIKYWHLDADRRWAPADLEALLAADDPAVPTCVFIHGNRADSQRAMRMGWGVYRRLARQADRPFRFVIWSWPAAPMRGRLLKDVRLKARRSDVESYYLALWVRRTDPRVPLSLIGYSLGARVITGALHLSAGGEVAGQSLPDVPAEARPAPVRAVLVAAAVDNTWLLPGRRNALAPDQTERILVTRNSCDPVLRWYRRLHVPRRPQALGYTGPACSTRPGPKPEKIEVLGLQGSVGRSHAWSTYFDAPGLRRRLAWYAFLRSAEPATRSKGSERPDDGESSEGRPAATGY